MSLAKTKTTKLIYSQIVMNSKIQFFTRFLLKKDIYIICLFIIFPKVFASNLNKGLLEETYSERYTPQQEIRGRVIAEDGLPLPGATVMEKGTNNGAITDFDGNFSLNVTDRKSVV